MNIFIIGVDGAGRSPFKTKWKNLEEFQKNAFTLKNMKTVVPSISAECWGSLLLGVSPDKHKYNNDSVAKNKHALDDKYPSIIRILKENLKDLNFSSFVHWNPINFGIFEDYPDILKFNVKNDREVALATKNYIENTKEPQFVFVHLDDLDHAGHEYNYFTEEYNKETLKSDENVKIILEGIKNSGKMDDSIIIITTDHGGGAIEKSHGTDKPLDVDTFAVIKAPNLEIGKTSENECSILDITPFILHTLGVKIPEHLEGNYENIK